MFGDGITHGSPVSSKSIARRQPRIATTVRSQSSGCAKRAARPRASRRAPAARSRRRSCRGAPARRPGPRTTRTPAGRPALDRHAAERVRAIEHDHRDAARAPPPHGQRHRPDVGVVAAADVLQVDDQQVDLRQLGRGRRQRFEGAAVEAGDRDARCGGRVSASTPIMSCASPRTPCSGPNSRTGRTPTSSRRSTMWVRSRRRWPDGRARRRAARAAERQALAAQNVETGATRAPLHGGYHGPLRAITEVGTGFKVTWSPLVMTLKRTLRHFHFCLRPPSIRRSLVVKAWTVMPLGRLALALQRGDVLAEDAPEVHRLVLLGQRRTAGSAAAPPGGEVASSNCIWSERQRWFSSCFFLDLVLVGLVAPQQARHHDVQAVRQPFEVRPDRLERVVDVAVDDLGHAELDLVERLDEADSRSSPPRRGPPGSPASRSPAP